MLLLCLVSPVVLCLGWVALWYFAQREAGNAMDDWFAGEAGRGRQWTCPDRQIGGFPLELRITCAGPALHGNLGGGLLDAAAAGMTVSASIYQPNAIEAEFGSPITIRKTGRDQASVIAFAALTLQARLLLDGRVRLGLVAEAPSLQDADIGGAAAHAELHVAPAAGRAASDKAYDVGVKIDDVLASAVDALTGETAPLSIDEAGVLTAVDPPGAVPWPVLVETWRQAGGIFDLTNLTMAKGDFKAQAQGRLALDDAHRVTGRLQTALSGYETLASRFGISPGALSVGNALAKLLGHDKAPPTDMPSIKLPVSFGDGRVAIGPVTTSVRLAPLY